MAIEVSGTSPVKPAPPTQGGAARPGSHSSTTTAALLEHRVHSRAAPAVRPSAPNTLRWQQRKSPACRSRSNEAMGA